MRPADHPHALRQYGRIFLVALLLVQQPLLASTITVNTGCTLVDAIDAANADAVAGGCPAGSGADTLELTGDVSLTAVDNIGAESVPNGLPQVASDVTIAGNGFKIERAAGAPEFRLFEVLSSGTLNLESVTLSNGHAYTYTYTTYYDPYYGYTTYYYYYYGTGGAVHTAGSLSLTDSHVVGNYAYEGGGGIHVAPSGDATLTNSTVTGNTAGDFFGDGGGIESMGPLSLIGSEVSGNYSSLTGGGIKAQNGPLTMTDSTVSDNVARLRAGGVAVFFMSDPATVTGSTISGNSVNLTAQGGGGLWVGAADLVLTNSTVSGNSSVKGSAVSFVSAYSSVSLHNSTVSGNSGSAAFSGPFTGSHTLSLTNSIVGNTTGGPNCGSGFSVIDNGGNLADDTTCGTVPATLTGLDPVLADNGGPTLTHALLDGSSAIDAAGACGLATDQRGVARGAACDSGAFEIAEPPTADDLIQLLIEYAQSLGLHHGIENALVSKLEAAQANLEIGNTGTAANIMGAFINQVEAQTGKKISPADAAEMIAAAQVIIALLLSG